MKRGLDSDSVLDWYSKYCPWEWNWNEPTILLRLSKVLGFIPMSVLWSIGAVVMIIPHFLWKIIFYVVGDTNINKSRSQLCALGLHEWEERGTVYHHPYAYANYCIYCGDCQNLDHPHAKDNKYSKRI